LLPVKDKWFRVLLILVLFFIATSLNDTFVNVTAGKLRQAFVSLCAIIIICEGSRYLVYGSHTWFKPRHRLWLVFAIGLSGTTMVLILSYVLRNYIGSRVWHTAVQVDVNVYMNGRKLGIGLLAYGLLNSLINFSALVAMFEILYRKAQWRQAERDRERLEKQKMKAELMQLKGIVNPHFLFNNLNSLSSLISENPERAQQFLDELTIVFRYLLRNNQTDLTLLSEELDFIKTYYQLLRTRYGQAISMDLQIDKSYEQLQIPPLTLQLLVENAVKHNRLQKDNPLHIELFSTPGGKLVVRNTISKKEGRVESSGIGLQTINARYKMLNQQGVVIEQTDKSFSVTISLIATEVISEV
jgi:two-component system, LytTR family, sensor kinase